jgi:hypothetical protein
MKYEAFFILPDSKIIPVEGSHIDKIIEMPDAFGLTRKRIMAVYKKHGERLPVEGFARIEILQGLLEQGYIRIRYRPTPDSFTIELARYNADAKKRIIKWVMDISEITDRVPLYTGFQIMDSHTGEIIASGTLREFID